APSPATAASCRRGADALRDAPRLFSPAPAARRRPPWGENPRRKPRRRHGGGRKRQELHPDLVAAPDPGNELGDQLGDQPGDQLLALDAALAKLAMRHPLKARLVELRYFAGLTVAQAAEILGISATTACWDWVFARAWLRRELEANPAFPNRNLGTRG